MATLSQIEAASHRRLLDKLNDIWKLLFPIKVKTTLESSDFILIHDSDDNEFKKINASSFVSGGGGQWIQTGNDISYSLGNVIITNNLTVGGTTTLTGTVTALGNLNGLAIYDNGTRVSIEGHNHNALYAAISHNHASTYEAHLGNPAGDDYILRSSSLGVREWIPITGITYTNATPIDVTIGGHIAGTTYLDKSYEDMWTDLLYPYQYPSFSAFAISGQTTTLECGVAISAGSKTFTWTTVNPSNVEPNTLVIRDVTAATDLATGLADDSSQAISISEIIKTTTTDTHQWSVAGTDTNSDPISARTFTVTWYSPFYYGVGAAALSVAQIQALTKQVVGPGSKTYSFSPSNEKFYFAYPASYGYLSSIMDPNGFNINPDFHRTTVDFTNNSPNYEGTTVSYYVYEYDNLTTQTGFVITFNF